MKKYILVLIILSAIALWPFFKNGYFESHDGEWMVIRFSAFHQTLAAGQFPVRFVDRLNNNYGYPVMNFLYPLPFYLAEIPKILGLGYVDSVKTVFILSTVFSTLAMFWAMLTLVSPIASLTASVLYLFVPYRFLDLYVRGSFGESVAFLFVPLVAGSIFKIAKGDKFYLWPLAVFVALLALSHNVIAALFVLFFLIMSYLVAKKEILAIVKSFLLGIAASAFFTVPAIYDLKFVKASQIKVSEIGNHLAGFDRLVVPSWGFGPDPTGPNGLSPQLGLVTITVLLSAAYLFFTKKLKGRVVVYFLAVAALITFLMTGASSPIWQNLPKIDIIQFPWRALSLIVFISAATAALVVDSSKKKFHLAAILTVGAILSTIFYTKPANFVQRDEGFYATNEDTTTARDEYLPLWVGKKPEVRASEKLILMGQGKIISQNSCADCREAIQNFLGRMAITIFASGLNHSDFRRDRAQQFLGGGSLGSMMPHFDNIRIQCIRRLK